MRIHFYFRRLLIFTTAFASLGALILILGTTFQAQAASPASADARPHTHPLAQDDTYVIRRGDTLAKIARRFDTSVRVLLDLNPKITNANRIFPGQRIQLPPQNDGDDATPEPTEEPTEEPAPTPSPEPTLEPTPTTTATPDLGDEIIFSDPGAAIEVFSPVAGTTYHSPIEVIGFSRTFESTLNLRLTDGDGNVLAERIATGGGVDGYDFFRTYLRFFVAEPTSATLELFESSAEDGSEINKVTLPLTLLVGQRFIDVDVPAPGALVCEAVTITGYSTTFEATVAVEVDDRSGEVLYETFAAGGGNGIYNTFSKSLAVSADLPVPLLIGAREESARDGSAIDWTRIPFAVLPTGDARCP